MTYDITHTDLDGIGCAIMLEKIYPKIQTFSIDYKDLDDAIANVLSIAKPGDTLYITDISMNEEQATICDKACLKVNHIDHHSSSKKLSDRFPWSFTDISHCATYHLHQMLSRYATLSDYDEFVSLVDNYDTWGHGTQPSDQAKDLNRLLSMIGAEAFLARFKLSGNVKLTDTEKVLIATDKYQEEQYLKEAMGKVFGLKDPDGNTFLMISAERYTSSLGNFLLQNFEEAEYVVIVDNWNGKVSLRSRGNVDVGELAKRCGGGGHKKAAGFVNSSQALKNFWRCDSCEWRRSGDSTLD